MGRKDQRGYSPGIGDRAVVTVGSRRPGPRSDIPGLLLLPLGVAISLISLPLLVLPSGCVCLYVPSAVWLFLVEMWTWDLQRAMRS